MSLLGKDMEFSGPPNYPREGGSPVSEAQISGEGPRPFYPAMCLRTHWDPTMILKRTLPTEYVPQALDPRPWTKICLEYTNTATDEPAPKIDPNAVLPSGGQFYPASRYAGAIDAESQLRRLDRPLDKWCEKDQYEPNMNGDMYNSRILVPKSAAVTGLVQELAFPKVLINTGAYDCRNQNDQKNVTMSDRLFNNATKQDRYKLLGKV